MRTFFNRRRFIKSAALLAGSVAVARPADVFSQTPNIIMTVKGPVQPKDMGITLTHEHVLVDFTPVAQQKPNAYNPQEVYQVALPYLQQAKQAGCRTFIDCTPTYLGRDPLLLWKLSQDTGLHILTNTGYYGARDDQNLPEHAFTETADQLSQRWALEFEKGILGTSVKPGFIKIGVDNGKLSDMDRKLVQAAARTHLKTGLTIAAHTGPAVAAFDEIAILQEEGVSLNAWIWVHAQSEPDLEAHVRAAQAGAWISLDGLGWNATKQHLKAVVNLKQNGLLNRVLLSHDAGWYHVGELGGGKYQPYTALFTEFIPAFQQSGFTEPEINQLLVQNPQEAFTIRVRRADG